MKNDNKPVPYINQERALLAAQRIQSRKYAKGVGVTCCDIGDCSYAGDHYFWVNWTNRDASCGEEKVYYKVGEGAEDIGDKMEKDKIGEDAEDIGDKMEKDKIQTHDYVIQQDGTSWMATSKGFKDLAVSDNTAFGDTPMSALRALLENDELPSKEVVVGKLSKVVDGMLEYFPEANVVTDNFSNKCWIEMGINTNSNIQMSKTFSFETPWAPLYDGKELVWATNEDRPARKGDFVGYLLTKAIRKEHDVLRSVEYIIGRHPSSHPSIDAQVLYFKNITPIEHY